MPGLKLIHVSKRGPRKNLTTCTILMLKNDRKSNVFLCFLDSTWRVKVHPYCLTHCGLETRYDLGQQWSTLVLAAWSLVHWSLLPDGTKPLPQTNIDWSSTEIHIVMKWKSNLRYFHSRKRMLLCHLQSGSHFVQASMCWCHFILQLSTFVSLSASAIS